MLFWSLTVFLVHVSSRRKEPSDLYSSGAGSTNMTVGTVPDTTKAWGKKMEMAESSSRPVLASSLLCDFVSWCLTSIYEGTVTAAPLSSFCASVFPIGNQTMPLEHQGFVLLYLLRQELNSSSSCLWLPQWVLPALWTNELVMPMSTKVTSAITTQNSHERLHDCPTVPLIRMQ